MIDLLLSGGWMMIPIIICSLIAGTIIIERFTAFRTIRHTPQAEKMTALAMQGKFADALAVGERHTSPVLRVLSAGIMAHATHPTQAMEAAGLRELAMMKRGLPALDTIITLAPLLGLLGTIIGMMDSFSIMAESGIGQPHAVTGGVAEALICTAAGIGVAVVTLVPYNYFLAQIENTTTLIEEYATSIEPALTGARKDASST